MSIRGQYSASFMNKATLRLSIGEEAFTNQEPIKEQALSAPSSLSLEDILCFPLPIQDVFVPGTFLNTNTIDEYRRAEKKELLHSKGRDLIEAIQTKEVLEEPAKLASFFLLSFSDLKKHKFLYWFAFPAVIDPAVNISLMENQALVDLLTKEQLTTFFYQLQSAERTVMTQAFFALQVEKTETKVLTLKQWDALTDEKKHACFLVFVDPCRVQLYPGWPLRNLLFLLSRTLGKKPQQVRVISLRADLGTSRVFSISLERSSSVVSPSFSFTGWEVNQSGKPGPRMVDLAAQLDPAAIAANALQLNLKLMTWRQFPELDIGKLQRQRVLLFGAGTLGCAVARTLLGWGFQHINFVDNGHVSHSNPVRQSLYSLRDVGQPKATTAASKVQDIAPGVESKGYCLTIPMPGHLVNLSRPEEVNDVVSTLTTLTTLIQQSDIIFLLTDSRESRWFPTVLSKCYNKVAINCALGFDSYLVMRHGVRPSDPKRPDLGCYFCNDVVAPQNSAIDKTLDQQCTVTKPGLAPIAAGMAVELLVSMLHHPFGAQAPTPHSASTTGHQKLPHQLRGNVYNFQQMLLEAPAFDKCIACSETVVNFVEDSLSCLKAPTEDERNDNFFKIFNEPTFLEQLTGLEALKAEAEAYEDIEDFSDFSD